MVKYKQIKTRGKKKKEKQNGLYIYRRNNENTKHKTH